MGETNKQKKKKKTANKAMRKGLNSKICIKLMQLNMKKATESKNAQKI